MLGCSRCVLPETYPGIVFDQDGVCNFCHSWQKEYDAMDYATLRQDLDRIVNEVKSKARRARSKYDVIVPLSGGKDSAYVLYVMREIYDCRVYAFNIDNGFGVPLARDNLSTLTERLDVDLEIRRLPLSLVKAGYRAFLLEDGEFCTMCEGTGHWMVADLVLRFLRITGFAPLVVSGWSRLYEFESGVYEWDMRRYYDVLDKHYLLDRLLEHLDKDALEILMSAGDPRQFVSSEQVIQLPKYWPWERTEIYRTLERIGWRSGPQTDTHFDCWANPVANWLTLRSKGVSQPLITDASLVRAGQMDREDALRRDRERNKARPAELIENFTKYIDIEERLLP